MYKRQDVVGTKREQQLLRRRTKGSGASRIAREAYGIQRKVFTTPLLSEAKSGRNTDQFTKKKSRCQRGGVRGAANQNATTERTNLQTKRCSKDEAAALGKTMLSGEEAANRYPFH